MRCVWRWYERLLGNRVSMVTSFSLGTFIKQVPITKLTYKTRAKTLSSTAVTLRHSYFDTLNSRQKDQIHLYVDALLHWNQRINLTAVTDANEVMERHVEDSLAIIPPIRNSYLSRCTSISDDNIKLVDVGSGAGLPGLILAIACPVWHVTLLESMNKRCIFLKHVVDHTGLSNVEVLRGRAENFGQNIQFREKFDVAVARAVAEMRILGCDLNSIRILNAEYCLPLVRVGGLFVAAKGHDPLEEIRNAERAIQVMGGSLLQSCTVESHSPYGQRTAVICLKTRHTPRKYPRDPGTPAKAPL